jgi:hypothetical protein
LLWGSVQNLNPTRRLVRSRRIAMNLGPYVAIWAVLGVVVLAIAIYRQRVARRDDQSLHIVEGEQLIAEQTKAYRKIGTIDRLGQSLTVFAILYGLVLAAVYLYHVWQESTKVQFR